MIPALKHNGRVLAAACGTLFVLAGGLFAVTMRTALADAVTSTTTTAQQQQALESQLAQLEGQIDGYENQITADKQKGSTLTGTINELNAEVAKVNLQIQATQLTLQGIDDEIATTQSDIATTQGAVIEKQAAVAALLDTLYKTDSESAVASFLEDPEVSNVWNDIKDTALFEAELDASVVQLQTLAGDLQTQSVQLATSESAAASAQAYEAAQAAQITSTKTQENQLLAATKGEESAYQALVVKTQQTAAQIRNQIFQLLGGGSLTFEQAYQYAQIASQATGVDPALILAVLDRESALGENVGQCGYKTAMSPSNIPVFLSIVQQLGLNPDDMMVSCPNADGVYGGAMGPAQFEPSTWELYATEVTAVTGDNPPSPWKNADAFVATALYLKDAQRGCIADYSAVLDQERCTAAKYYAGSDWANYLWTYGEAIVSQAQTFTQDITTITSPSS